MIAPAAGLHTCHNSLSREKFSLKFVYSFINVAGGRNRLHCPNATQYGLIRDFEM